MAFGTSESTKSASRTATSGSRTIISQDLVITGTILTDGEIEVNGTVEGDICARMVVIGGTATVQGEVVAENVSVSGTAQGRITARRILLRDGSHVQSDLIHQRLGIEEGAEFEGSVLRKKDDAAWEDITKTFDIPGVELTDDAARAVNALGSEFEQTQTPGE